MRLYVLSSWFIDIDERVLRWNFSSVILSSLLPGPEDMIK